MSKNQKTYVAGNNGGHQSPGMINNANEESVCVGEKTRE